MLSPLRGLGSTGVITDLNPSDIPITGFSLANNVRFADGKVQRAPVFRTVIDAIKSTLEYEAALDPYSTTPGFYHDVAPLSGSPVQRFVSVARVPNLDDKLMVCDNDGTVRAYTGTSFEDYSPVSGFVRTVAEDPWTACELAGIHYLNRVTDRPYHLNPATGSNYDFLPNWPSTWRTRSLRAYGDFLIAMNTQKGGVEYPKTVNWSDIALSGAVPSSWDIADLTKNAGENTLAALTSPIVDGLALNDDFIIYSSDQVWKMELVGGEEIFTFRRLFALGGVIAPNCVVEVERKHFVFGYDDIYVHDGVTQQSIADGRVRDFIYGTMVRDKAPFFFVVHNPILNEILFCYHALDADVAWQGVQFANKAAVYNYRNDTWSFMDLPNVASGVVATVTQSPSYQYAFGDFQTSGGSFAIQQDDGVGQPILLGVLDTARGLSESRIYGLDLLVGGRLPFPLSTEVLKPCHATRVGIDLDELAQELRGYKMLKGIYPQATTKAPDSLIYFSFGSSDYPGQDVTFGPGLSFDPLTEYKVDTRTAGRYLAYKLYTDVALHFEVSGFDADLVLTGRR